MPKLDDLTGTRFGRLIVIGEAEQRGPKRRWHCQCDCGTKRTVSQPGLRSGHSTSCGCRKGEMLALLNGEPHGMSRTREYRSWAAMKSRCYNENYSRFDHWGGRGIHVCDTWRESFTAFLADMGPRPRGTTLDRIDQNGNYEPKNCRWATHQQQSNNCRSNVHLTFMGETMTMMQWARRLGIEHATIRARIKGGWSAERALGETTRPYQRRSNGSCSLNLSG